MGLAERRLAENLKANKVPIVEANLKQLAGFDLVLAIDWDTFIAFDEYPISRLETYLDELTATVGNICIDQMGKEALTEKLATIKLTNTDKYEDAKMELKDKILHLVVQFAGDTTSSYSSADITSYLEKLL